MAKRKDFTLTDEELEAVDVSALMIDADSGRARVLNAAAYLPMVLD
jgi:hypothetical protein